MIASRELFAPISCILLVTHFQMFQASCPIIKIEDGPKEFGVGCDSAPNTPETYGQRAPNTPEFAQLAGDDRLLTLLKRGYANSGVSALRRGRVKFA